MRGARLLDGPVDVQPFEDLLPAHHAGVQARVAALTKRIAYSVMRRHELSRFNDWVTDWERNEYPGGLLGRGVVRLVRHRVCGVPVCRR